MVPYYDLDMPDYVLKNIQKKLHGTKIYDYIGREDPGYSEKVYQHLINSWKQPTFFKDVIHMFYNTPRVYASGTAEYSDEYPSLLFDIEYDYIQYQYYKLIWDLTKRDMYEKGFQMSRENQDELITRMLKEHDKKEDYHKKYPWS